MIKQGRLIIRKTYEPNHAKLYIFKLQLSQIARNSLFITGSSNLTCSGLKSQDEFPEECESFVKKCIEVLIIDEAHRFRNEETLS